MKPTSQQQPYYDCKVEVMKTVNSLRKKVRVKTDAPEIWLEYYQTSGEGPRLATPPRNNVPSMEKDLTPLRGGNNDKGNKEYVFEVLRLRAESQYTVEVFYEQKRLIGGARKLMCGKDTFQTDKLPYYLEASNIRRISRSEEATFALAVQTFHYTFPKYREQHENAIYAFDEDGHIVWYIAQNEVPKEIQKNFRFYSASPLKHSFNWLVQGYSKLIEVTPTGGVVSSLDFPLEDENFVARYHHDITALADENYAMVMSFELFHADRPLCPREKLPGAKLIPHAVTTFLRWDRSSNTVSYVSKDTELEGIDIYRDRTNRSCTMYLSKFVGDLSCKGLPRTGICSRARKIEMKVKFPDLDLERYYVPFDAQDWAHANSIIQPATDPDKLIVSFRHLNSLLLVSSDMKRTFWRIGSIPGSSLEFENPSDRFYGQHSGQLTEEGHLVLFDNGRNRPKEEGGAYSRVVQYRLDWDAGKIRKMWEFMPGREFYSECCSSVLRLPNGNWWALFGSRPHQQKTGHGYFELSPQGEELARYTYYNKGLRATYRSWPVETIAGERIVSASIDKAS